MPHVIKMASVMAGADEAALASWSVAVGDRIESGSVIAELETEKALVDLESDAAGIVRHLAVAPGASVEVGGVLAILEIEGDTSEAVAAAIAEVTGDVESAASEAPSATFAVETAPAPLPVALAPAAGAESALTPAAGSSLDEEDPPSAPNARIFASPLARRIALQRGLDIAALRGSGPGGRIMRSDVERALSGAAPGRVAASAGDSAGGASTPAPTAAESASDLNVVPISRMRAAIARRLSESKATVPHFYLTGSASVEKLLELRRQLNAEAGVQVSVNDLVVKAAGAALAVVPALNRVWAEGGVTEFATCDVAVAVALDEGLVTPVVHDVHGRSVSEVSRRIRDLAARAKAGALKQAELSGGAMTVSNLGMFGTENFAAIINPPQAAILAVGAAAQVPFVRDGELVIDTRMSFTLSADHRVVDGADGARWVSAFTGFLEAPLTLLA